MPVIEVRDLVKDFRRPRARTGRFSTLRTLFSRQYDTVHAVSGVSFTVERGDVVGYIGSNGAGKSTTIKMLTGILEPTHGEVLVNGIPPSSDRTGNARQIGVVFGQRTQLWWDLPLVESLKIIATLYRVDPLRYEKNMAYLNKVLGLEEFLTTPVRQLSLGQRMRGDLAAAFLHEPPVLYLDEPTIGLDVHTKDRVCSFIDEVSRDKQCTIVLTTHDLTDIERLCNRVILIDHGKMAFDGSVEQLKGMYAPTRTLFVQYEPSDVSLFALQETVDSGSVVDAEPGQVSLRLPAVESSVPNVLAAVEERCRITDLSISETSLEDVIKQIYQPAESTV
ncbi:ATP-binding cassette domain-containing protein [Streptomyces californicus]|uniref:ABC transporter ATP-binding protein n=1 Tax=Streptomyces californicus TaxID=67351 RepID=UPI00296EB492|nr:ATP-binding cassette domain-containing protein [Streptomyces californicus]MDW4901637.1 ATP-binding cassette domain-containing protein [Streptomyces californicus]